MQTRTSPGPALLLEPLLALSPWPPPLAHPATSAAIDDARTILFGVFIEPLLSLPIGEQADREHQRATEADQH
jgi:hypothetical protein